MPSQLTQKKYSHLSLSNEYFLYSLVIILTIFILSAFYYCYTYSLYTREQNDKIQQAAEKLEQGIKNIQEANGESLKTIGYTIADLASPQDAKKIEEILENAIKHQFYHLSGTEIEMGWARSDGKITVNNTHRQLPRHLLDISHRSYFRSAREKPWTLQISSPVKSDISTTQVLPMAMGIENHQGRFIGYLTLSIDLKEINENLIHVAETSGVSFIITDDNCHIISKSQNMSINASAHLCEQNSIEFIKGKSGFLTQPLVSGSMTYPYYKKMLEYPNLILTGYDKHVLEKELHQSVFPKLYNFILMGLFCTIILYFFRKKIITPISTLSNCAMVISKGNTAIKIPKQTSIEMFHLAKALILVKHYIKRNETYRKKLEAATEIIKTSAEAREEFAKSINQELVYPLKEILIYTEILANEILRDNHNPEKMQHAVKCIEKIREATTNIKHKTSSSLNLSYFDFKEIVIQAVNVNLKQSHQKNVEIKTFLDESIPWIYGDPLKLKQVIVGLVSQSIENSPENEFINVSVKTLSKDGTAFIQVVIEDKSFGLSEDELQRIQKKVGWHDQNTLFTNMEYQVIDKLVKMHFGTFNAENKLHKGRTIYITFPILKEQHFTADKSKNNIHYLYPNH